MSDYYATTALLPDGRLERVKLEDYQGSFVLLLFYPGDFTDLAKGEILAFAESSERFTANQCQVILHTKFEEMYGTLFDCVFRFLDVQRILSKRMLNGQRQIPTKNMDYRGLFRSHF